MGLIPKPCAGIRNSVQPGMTVSSKRANPGPYRAQFGSGYLMSGMLITASNTPQISYDPESTSSPIRAQYSPRSLNSPNPGSVQAPFRVLQGPVRSKTPGVFALTGGPEERLTKVNPGILRADFGARDRIYWDLNSAPVC